MRNHFGLLLFAAVSAACSANQPPAKSGHNAPDSAEQSPAAQAGGEDNRLVAWGFAQGKKALREGRANDAVQFFTGVVDRRPEHAWANHFLGVSLEQAGD
ncbi:MAG: hypothetical protein MUF54_19685, partial [Polyangiaceae bacterium]|nr:hypothetical protein [Polyangiaceae bacterium]